MSAQGPSNPFGDRPRMAEALASLKEGLRDTADPLYDGWKLRPRAPGLAHPQTPLVENVSRPAHDPNGAAADLLADAGDTIEITLDESAGDTPISETEPETPRLSDDDRPAKPPLNDWLGDGLPTEVQLIEALNEEGAPTIERRLSVQTDTVRVRIVRYQHFPRWALIAAAALLVFALSVLVLRASFLRQSARSTRAVLTSETPTTSTALADRARFAAPRAVVAPSPPTVATPARTGARVSPSASAEAAPPLPAELGTKSSPHASISSPPPVVSASPPAAKIPTPSSRRRPAGHDFFRDPGF